MDAPSTRVLDVRAAMRAAAAPGPRVTARGRGGDLPDTRLARNGVTVDAAAPGRLRPGVPACR